MQDKDKTPKKSGTDEILKVFSDLGLEDAEERDRFRKLVGVNPVNIRREGGHEYQETRNNTAVETENLNA